MSRPDSYVTETFDLLLERYRPGDTVTVGDVLTLIGPRSKDGEERARFSGALACLASYHGTLERTGMREGRWRVYRVTDQLKAKNRPHHRRRLGITMQRRSGAERRVADPAPEDRKRVRWAGDPSVRTPQQRLRDAATALAGVAGELEAIADSLCGAEERAGYWICHRCDQTWTYGERPCERGAKP